MQRTRTYKIAGLVAASLLCARAAIAQPLPPVDVGLPTLPNMPPAAPAMLPPTGVNPAAPPMLPPVGTIQQESGAGALPAGANLPVLPKQAMPAPGNPMPPAAAQVQAQPQPAAPENGLPEHSFGDSTLSILFLPEQIDQLKAAVLDFERSGGVEAAPTVVAPVVPGGGAPIPEPPSYPVFYLSTIVFDGPNDWSIWVSGEKITSRKNDTDIQALNVTRDSVTFTWLPTYSEAVARRLDTDDFAKPDAVKNKLAVAQPIQRDATTGLITFTLRQNQSFATAYFKLFEGYMENPALPPLSITPGAPGAVPATGMPPQNEVPSSSMPVPQAPQNPADAMGISPGSIPPNQAR